MLRAGNLLLALVVACGGTAASNRVPDPPREKEFTAHLPAAAFLNELDDRERREQMRDWGVFATLAHEGATPEETAAATYQMPAARLPYLDELYAFSYGRGRRAYLDQRVLLFVDADDPDQQATIGRLADQVRMELGEVPRVADIYVVEDQRSTGTLRIAYKERVEGPRLFSPDYGYVAAEASSASELAAWLSEVDDLSQIRIEPDKLVLGGRRFAKSRTEGVTLEDVAALYQAADRIHDREARVETTLNGLEAKYKAEFWRRMAAEGYYEGRRYTTSELQRAEQAQRRIAAALKAEAEEEAKTVVRREHGPSAAGFSLDPRWLPAPDASHPLMLVRLQQLASEPCEEISRIAQLAPQLLQAEPDESRRSGEAWAAMGIADLNNPPSTCAWLQDFAEQQLRPMIRKLEAATPEEWREGFGPYYQVQNDIQAKLAQLNREQAHAADSLLVALRFYDFEAGVQCARYDETGGTAVGMTLFYTDLLAKLWQGVDYDNSAPLRAIPGFLTLPRIDLAPAFAEELERLPATRIWFGPRTDGVSRSTGESAPTLAFVHRFSRVYAAGSDPAKPHKESTPNEPSRLSIGWWDRHFDEVADHEQQYHRQNQIMKWSAATAAIRAAHGAPTFLASITVDRTARFFTWFAAHRNQLRFKEPVPERHTPYDTECLPRLHSYPFTTAGTSRSISGGVSLAGEEALEATPMVNLKLPPGQRVVAAAEAESLPLHKLEGRTVSIANQTAARVRSQAGPINLNEVAAQFEGQAGAPTITVNSKAGSVAQVTFKPVTDGVRINLRAGPVEQVRAALERPGERTIISFAEREEWIIQRGDTLVEVAYVDKPTGDGSAITVTHDSFGSGWRETRTADPGDVVKRMDGYEWQVVTPGRGATAPPRVHFSNEPPPSAAREMPVQGLDGVGKARVTDDGEIYFQRPAQADQRAAWHDLSRRPGLNNELVSVGRNVIQLSERGLQETGVTADQLMRSGRLEEAVTLSERAGIPSRTTLEDRTRAALLDIGRRNAVAVRSEIEALATRGHEITPETRSLLVDGLRNHGDVDVAMYLDAKLQGKQFAPELSIIEDRGHVTLKYEARRIETEEFHDTPSMAIGEEVYFSRRLLVGREGFEPDFSGPITRWIHDPDLTVRVMKNKPFTVAPGILEDGTTKQQFLRAHDPHGAKLGNLPLAWQRVYLIEPRGSNHDRCDHSNPRGPQDCADEQ